MVHLDCPIADWCTAGVCTPRDARVPGDWETLDQALPRDMAGVMDQATVLDSAPPTVGAWQVAEQPAIDLSVDECSDDRRVTGEPELSR